jgi:hypothetical protein
LVFKNRHRENNNNNNNTGNSGNNTVQQDSSSIQNNNLASGEPQNSSMQANSSGTDTKDTTTFVDDGIIQKRDESHNFSISDMIIKVNDTQLLQQSVIDFLRKPVIVSNGTFSTTDTYSFFNSVLMPSTVLNSTQGTMWYNKLIGYFGIRMDMRFKLVVNGNRFQQGRYILGWTPLNGAISDSGNLRNISTNNLHNATLVQRTTVPHVEIDINTDTACELLVPFSSVDSFYPLNAMIANTNIGTLGYINLYPYSPLVSPAGSVTATYTLYVSFENVSLYGAASAQSGLSDRELGNKFNGPISSVADAVSRGFKEFSNIPLLSNYANSISWVSDRIANTAAIFGFSKPSQGDGIIKVELLNNPNHTVVDGDSDCRSLALLSKPGVTRLLGQSGTDYDEMDFSYIASKYAWFQTQTWTESSTVGNLFSINVTPFVPYVVGSTYNLPPVSFVNNFFGMWRGSVKYRFKLVKTLFHSGRLEIAFYPTDENTYVNGPEYVNRLIWDIREASVIELEIPYICRNMWLTTGVNTGQLVVNVIDPLIAPATVSNAITILCEIAGGRDMEFAIPNLSYNNIGYLVPQSGLVQETEAFSSTIGNTTIKSNPILASSLCIGDKVSNFRTLLKRFHPIIPYTAPSATYNFNNNNGVAVIPDLIPYINGTAVNGASIADPLAMVASCYGIWRGGVRIKDVLDLSINSATADIYCNAPAVVYMDMDAVSTNTNFSTIWRDISNTNVINTGFEPRILQNIYQNNTLSVEMPQYSRKLSRAVADCLSNQGSSTSYYQYYYGNKASTTLGNPVFQLPKYMFAGSFADYPYSLHNIYRAASDDTDFGCFISVPPLLRTYNTTVYSNYF